MEIKTVTSRPAQSISALCFNAATAGPTRLYRAAPAVGMIEADTQRLLLRSPGELHPGNGDEALCVSALEVRGIDPVPGAQFVRGGQGGHTRQPSEQRYGIARKVTREAIHHPVMDAHGSRAR